MRKHDKDYQVQRWGVSLVWVLASLVPERETSMVSLNIISDLVAAATKHPNKIKLLHQVFGAMRNLVIQGDAGKLQVLTLGLSVISGTIKNFQITRE